MTSNYTAESDERIEKLQLAREKLNFDLIRKEISKRGDLRKISEKYEVNPSVLCRAMKEQRLLSLFPGILKSKSTPLSMFKSDRELKLFFKTHNIKKLGTREVYKHIRKWNKKLEKNPKKLLTSKQHDLIIGSTFGDAYIRQRDKNCNFRVSHSPLQKKYLLKKYKIMKEFTLSEPKWNMREVNGRFIETLELATFTHPVFNYYRKLFYKNGVKEISREALDLLNPRSLAFWLCDDGSYDNKQGYIVLCTNSYSIREHKIMKEYFNEIWNLDPTIGFRDKKYYYLRFKQEDSKRLIKIVELFVPRCMKYKIGE